MTITFDLPSEVAERLGQKASEEGQDLAEYLRRLAVMQAEAEGSKAVMEPRKSGLHAGWYEISEDFDAPLPDNFWLGANSHADEMATA